MKCQHEHDDKPTPRNNYASVRRLVFLKVAGHLIYNASWVAKFAGFGPMSGSSKPTERQWFSLTQDHKIFAPMARLQKPCLHRAPTLAQRLAQPIKNASQCQLQPNRSIARQTGRPHPQYPFVSLRSRGDYYARPSRDRFFLPTIRSDLICEAASVLFKHTAFKYKRLEFQPSIIGAII